MFGTGGLRFSAPHMVVSPNFWKQEILKVQCFTLNPKPFKLPNMRPAGLGYDLMVLSREHGRWRFLQGLYFLVPY